MATTIGRADLTLVDLNDVTASITAPSNPTEGALWFNENDNQLYVYSINQWVLSTFGLEIGGRNLLKNSRTTNISSNNSVEYPISVTEMTEGSVKFQRVKRTDITKNPTTFSTYNTISISSFNYEEMLGKKVTISARVRVSEPTTGSLFSASYSPTVNFSEQDKTRSFGTQWETVTQTVDSFPALVGSGGIRFTIYKMIIPQGKIADFYFDIRDWKIEIGGIATDWTPAPEDVDAVIIDIQQTIGNMANDNLLDFEERQVIKDKLTEITGIVTADTTTTLPTTATLDAGLKGEFYTTRKSALNAGLLATDARYIDVATKYTALKTYLDAMTPVKPWDLRTTTQSSNITVVKATFRTNWLNYYTAVNVLAVATAEKLKQNVDNVIIGGANHALNGNFSTPLADHAWAGSYVGQTKEIVDISTETPPFKYAYHVKNTTATNGGIFTPILWDGLVAESLVDKEVTVSFWLKYQNITVGAAAYNSGRFGELSVEGLTSTGAKVNRYFRVTATNTSTDTLYIAGTDTVWKKYTVTHKLLLPATAVKLSRVLFKHGIEGCIGEFWTTGIQVEIGNKGTDWKYSDVDMQEKFTNVEFKISDSEMVRKVTGSSTFTEKVKTAEDNAILYANNMQIGGRNLLRFSSYDVLVGEEIEATGEIQYNNTANGTKGIAYPISDYTYPAGEYTISFEKKTSLTDTGVSSIRLAGGAVGSSLSTIAYIGRDVVANGVYKKISYTFKLNVESSLSLQIYNHGFGVPFDAEVSIRQIKIEKGSKATDWTPAVEDISEDITYLTTQMSSVTEVMTEDGIFKTFTETQAFKDALEGKAEAGSVGVSGAEVADMIDNIDIDGAVGTYLDAEIESEESKLTKTFSTKLEVEETSKQILNKFSASGGMNLLQNSIGFADLNNWYLGVGDSAVGISTTKGGTLDSLGFGSGFQFVQTTNPKELFQDVVVVAGKIYTLSWYLMKINPVTSSNFKIEILDSGVVLSSKTYTEPTDNYKDDNVLFVPTSNKVTVKISGTGVDIAVITGLMLTIGDVPLQWSMATGEVYNTNIRLDKDGIRVSKLDADKNEVGYTSITPSEFAGYYRSATTGLMEKVFYLREDETVSKKFRATDEITMGSVRILNIQKAGNNGWAFVPIVPITE